MDSGNGCAAPGVTSVEELAQTAGVKGALRARAAVRGFNWQDMAVGANKNVRNLPRARGQKGMPAAGDSNLSRTCLY